MNATIYRKTDGELGPSVNGTPETLLALYDTPERGLVEGTHDAATHKVDVATRAVVPKPA